MDSRERAAHRRIWSSACNPGHGDAGAGATGRHGDAGKGSADGRTTRRHGRALRQVDRTACRRIAALACARTRGRAGALGGASAPGRLARKSVGSGKSVYVRVDLGGRSIIKKTKKTKDK